MVRLAAVFQDLQRFARFPRETPGRYDAPGWGSDPGGVAVGLAASEKEALNGQATITLDPPVA